MAWLGIWYEHEARQGGRRDPRQFTSLGHPVIYPYAHSFIENETSRLEGTEDPSRTRKGGELHSVYYSLNHDGGQGGLHQQGCAILQWLFQNFEPGGNSAISKRFCEIPVIIHAVNPARAAAMANALPLLRFLAREEDQAVAKIPRTTSVKLVCEDGWQIEGGDENAGCTNTGNTTMLTQAGRPFSGSCKETR